MPGSERETFIKLSDHMPEHPKVEGLSDKAFRALVSLWCWCSRSRTDGHIPLGTWTKRAPGKAGRELVAAGLVDEVDGEMWMHDYLKHQRSKEHIEAVSAKRAAAGQRGGKVRPSDKQDASKVLSKEEAEDPPEDRGGTTYPPDKETEAGGSGSVGGSGGSSSRKRSDKSESNGHRLPDDWWPKEADQKWFRENCPTLSAIGGRGSLLTEEFVDYWQSRAGKEARKTNWSKTWRNRMREREVHAADQAARRGAFGAKPATSDERSTGALALADWYAQQENQGQQQMLGTG